MLIGCRQKFFIFFVALFMAVGCCLGSAQAQTSQPSIDTLTWLEGNWTTKVNGEEVDEQWMAPKNGLMLGLNRTTREGKRSSFEYMRIVQRAEGIVFIAQPSGQAPVEFPASQVDGNSIVFENSTNDFPKRIVYKLDDQKRLYARIEGEVGGKVESMEWTWTKVDGGVVSSKTATSVSPAKSAPTRIPPTVADCVYGQESERQTFDFWQAPSEKPTPVVLLIHGGGWVNGDKTSYSNAVIESYLNAGISVAALNYRFIGQAMEQQVEPPVKACVEDAARALQTIRYRAMEWNVDKTRIGASGGSAGACTSLWLAFHDDLADPSSDDPILRESTRLTCAAVTGGQTSLDPLQLREWISNANYAGHAFGFWAKGRTRPEEFDLALKDRERILPWIRQYSPIEIVSKDDPPVFLEYPNQKTEPQFGGVEPDPTHSVIYGLELKKRMDSLGVSCTVCYPATKMFTIDRWSIS